MRDLGVFQPNMPGLLEKFWLFRNISSAIGVLTFFVYDLDRCFCGGKARALTNATGWRDMPWRIPVSCEQSRQVA